MAITLHHFALTVENLEKSIEFYTNKLGFKIHGEDTRRNKYIYLTLANSEISLELLQSREKLADQNHGNMRPHLALSSDDIENDLKSMESKGLKSLEGLKIIPGDVKIFTVIDPDGYYIDVGQEID